MPLATRHEKPLYLDYNATTPLDPRVFEAMKPWFLDEPGNAGSRTHVYGKRARDAVEAARRQVAEVLDAKPEEIVFTSGATESNNLALLGLAKYGEEQNRKHIVSTAIEHKAVLEPLDYLISRGFEVDLAPVTPGGYVEPDEIKRRLRPDTLLVSVMHANNETGVMQPVLEIAELLTESPTLLHVDSAQTFGKEVEELKQLRCDFLSISGHKMYAPKGIGALYVRRQGGRRPHVSAISFGGGQERGLRPGTLPVPLAVGLGKAAELAATEFQARREQATKVKQQLLADLRAVDHAINGDSSRSQSHVINISFAGVDSEALMMAVRDDIAFSNGSACTSSSYNPSHVLTTMGLDEQRISESARISWGPGIAGIPTEVLVSAVIALRV